MKKKFLKLMEKEGFILFLFVCVCVVAGGTIYLSMRNLNVAEEKEVNEDLVIVESVDGKESYLDEIDPSDSIVEEVFEEDIAALNLDEEDPEELQEPEQIEKPEIEQVKEKEVELEFIEEEDSEDVKSVNSVEEKVDLILPIEGPIVTEFTKDSLVYSKTLESWVGHKAIDIGAKEGTPVLASMDGVVEKIYEDELWGIVIIINHGNNLKTKYANLSTKEMVKEGVRVKKGDNISKVGKSSKIEMLMEPHLHFEVIKNEEIVDPRSINN